MPIAEGGRWSPVERIVSPGVFTRENDLSFLPQGISNIGGAIVAPFPKGPAFCPMLIENQADLDSMFGVSDGVYYGPYTAREYLKNQGQVTIVRVGALGGYVQLDPLIIYAKPVTTNREFEHDVVDAKLKNCLVELTGSEYRITGSLSVTWVTGDRSGSSEVIGTINEVISNWTGSLGVPGQYNSGSITTASFVTASISEFILPAQGDVELVGSQSLSSYNLLITPFPGNPNKSICVFEAGTTAVIGNYGPFDLSTQTDDSTRDRKVLAVLTNTAFDVAQNLFGFQGSTLTKSPTGSITDEFNLVLTQTYLDQATQTEVSSSYGTYNFSLDPGSPKYITEIFPRNAKAGLEPVAAGVKLEVAYPYVLFEDAIVDVVGEMTTYGDWEIAISSSDGIVFDEDLEEFVPNFATKFSDGVPGGGGGNNDAAWSQYDIRGAETPFIRSQEVAPWVGAVSGSVPASQSFELFKFHTIKHGTPSNKEVKVEISNVKLAGTVPGSDFCSFDVSIRAFDDNDARPVVLENFPNCTLDPDSVNFVARKIGDAYQRINFSGKVLEFGCFGNSSRFVRVEMTKSPYPKTSVPYGFGPYASPIGGDLSDECPPMTYICASTYTKNPGRYPSGIQFNPAPLGADVELEALYPKGTNEGPEQDNKEYFAPIPIGATTRHNTAFDLYKDCGISPVYNAAEERNNVRKRKFMLGFQFGFDGQSPSIPIFTGDDILPTNQQGLDCSRRVSSGSVGYSLSIAALGNADEYDINLIATPGIIYNYHPSVVVDAIDMCEARGDCFYIFDIYQNQLAGGRSVQNVVDKAAEFDTNYAATYYPWMKILDTNTNQIVPVPPSVVMPGVYAQSDRASAEWFAPAGLTRGGIEVAKKVMDKLTHQERDTLYEGRVNPIVNFPGQGVTVWGQKTLQVRPSALDRINVRRLLINVKKFIASSSKFLVFEQNVAVTRNRFLAIANPYLESVQQRSGLYAFRVVMDENNNTPDVVDRNILYGQLYLQPTRTAEFILLDFNVQPSGASFDF
jgi:hypothetical protein